MDIRDKIRSNPEIVVGHKVIYESLNLQNEVKRFSQDPLEELIKIINDTTATYVKGDIGRYLQAYSWYRLCLRRTLSYISLARRASAELRHYPRNKKYSSRQQQLAAKYNKVNPYLELDYQNLIIHACILLDRVITMSRRFITGNNLPSFTSFHKHKEFFLKKPKLFSSNHSEYIQNITQNTGWFEIPLKVLRDKFLMHSSEKHMSFFGWPDSNWDLVMVTIIPAVKNQPKLFEKVKTIKFTPRRLARDIESFLIWFANYGLKALKQHPTTHLT